jgi:hypothetical protein
VIRKNEAAIAAAAFFSNVDVVNVSASNEKNPMQVAGASLYKELLQHRLTKTIPWFLTLIGAAQDAMSGRGGVLLSVLEVPREVQRLAELRRGRDRQPR